jgi:chromosomal replication initiation ATPase DnaA
MYNSVCYAFAAPVVAKTTGLDADTALAENIRRCIINRVACDFALDVTALETRRRGSQHVAFARQVAMYLAHVGFGLSYDAIGRIFERDRTTVSHACRVVEDRRDDIWFDCRMAMLEQICRGANLQEAL